MTINEFIQTTEGERLTPEVLNKAFEAVLRNSRTEPRHDCRFDGCVLVFGTTRCMYCGQPV